MSYWKSRKDALYLAATRQICERFCPRPRSVVDIGSNGTPILEWFEGAYRLVSVDLRNPYRAPGVESVQADFLAWKPPVRFDLALCLQVLEHVPEPEEFAHKLLRTGRTVVASVPYRWSKTACRYHLHDPVDEAKMRSWFGRDPVYGYVATELHGVRRLIHVYQ